MAGEEGNTVAIIEKLAWQYALEHSNIESPTALGDEAAAYGNHSLALGYKSTVGFGTDGAVALGANSLVTLDDMVGDGTKAPFSNINLNTQGTAVNGINEYLLGPVAIGGKDKDSTTKVYLRQLKYVADGTADTDAVNLRQLKAAVGNSGTTGGDNNGGSGNSGSSIVYEAGDNITITDGKNDHTKVISATGITDIKNQVTDLNGRVDKVEDSMNTMNHRITKLDRRVDKVGAGAAALAALHPLDFDPDNKWDIAGGYGHYAGQSAMALGAYYRPNEDVMFSIGGAFGNGEDMINAGVSVKVGSGGSKTTTSKAAMAKKINELETNMAKQETEIQELKELVKKLSK
ncbi:YadA-like family protein [Veillonella magna]|uniref:YadA-like family protein n=2 Tax=Veillonella magna TaxID=464322 RepID=A0ABS2GHH4_9FIRM|nr:YadA-like family protein [Veillonella magna]